MESQLQSLSIVERASLLIAAPVRFDTPPEEVATLVEAVTAGDNAARPGALWVEAASIVGLAAARSTLPARWSPILALSTDRGLGAVIAGTAAFPPLSDLIRAGWGTDDLRDVGRIIAREAHAAGISLPIAAGPPILDTPDPLFVARDSSALAEGYAALFSGASDAGVPLGLRLYWSPDTSLVTTTWDRARFEVVEAAALTGALAGGLGAVTVGAVGVPALDPEGAPANRSAAAIRGSIRRDAGFQGLVIADLRNPRSDADPTEEVVAAVRAGADLVVTRVDPGAAAAALVAAVTVGAMPQSRIDTAARRVLTHMSRRDERTSVGGTGIPLTSISEGADRLRNEASQFLLRASGGPGATASAPRITDVAGRLMQADPDSAAMSADDLASIDYLMQAGIADSVFTAAAVVVLRKGVVAYAEGIGTSSDGSVVDLDYTMFDIASLTKVVGTTTAVALLVDRGDLQLDAPVEDYLPDFRGEGKADVTIRQLLTHTSGLASGLWVYGTASSPEEALSDILEHRLARDPGEQVVYSDLGFILLAEIVEQVTGRSIDHFLAEELFIPLGMSATMYLPPSPFRGRTVSTAGENERPYPLVGVVHDANSFRLGGTAGHAGIFSTAANLAVFAEMMLREGQVGGVRILPDSIVEIFRTIQPGADDRALGWDTPADISSAGRFASARTFGHTGYTGTSIWIDPEYDMAVVLLANRSYPVAGPREILEFRTDVHEVIYQSITDRDVPRRRGAR